MAPKNKSNSVIGEVERTSNEGTPNPEIVIRTTEMRLEQAQRSFAIDIFNINELPRLMTLANMSRACAGFQLCQAVILLFLAIRSGASHAVVNIFTSYPEYAEESSIAAPNVTLAGTYSIKWLPPVFLLSSGIEHACCVVFSDQYHWFVERNQNPFRWTEYTFSASLMRVLTAHFAGVSDIHLLFCIFILSAASIQDAATMEAVNGKARADDLPMTWRPFWSALLSHMASWIVIYMYVAASARETGEGVAMFIIAVILFLMDASFAIIFTLQWRKIGIFRDYVNGEIAFMILSCTAKTLLAWLIAFDIKSHVLSASKL